ncbi:MAG: biotin--[acetyl-CoA-carboxylase] ligase [Geminicoccaceae bacterium]|nr:MAG: biotin--[acetyl-CoA-carboxylase] ligase [Geminicoccaceae bacterium]
MSADELHFRVERHARVASTNDLARAAAERGEPEGLWILAEVQTAGRGRQGRSWSSPAGNFHGSLLLRPTRPLGECATLSLVAALAVAEAVETLCEGRIRPRVKWPNDVLVGRAKLAGILPEAIAAPDGSCAALILGIGVNLAHHPTDLDRPATSLAALGEPVPTLEAFAELLSAPLAARYALWQREGFGALREAWLARAVGLGEPVRLAVGELVHEGRLADLGRDGSILLESPAGCLVRFTAGELFLGEGEEPRAATAPAAEASRPAAGRL